MSEASFKFEKSNRSLFERLFEPPTVGTMSPVAKVVAYALLAVWSVFVLFPIYWVIITSFKDAAAVNQGPFYVPFLDFQPTLDAWRSQFNYRLVLRSAFGDEADVPSRLQFLCIHCFAGGHAAADGTSDLQDTSCLHELHRCQRRIDHLLRRRRRNGRLRARACAVQAQVRQHPHVRCSSRSRRRSHELRRRSMVGLHNRRACPVLSARARIRQAFQAHIGQRRHPFLDHLPADPAAHRRDHSDLRDVPVRWAA